MLRNSPSTVSTYADACELLALTAFVTSASLSKNKFFDRLKSTALAVQAVLLCYSSVFSLFSSIWTRPATSDTGRLKAMPWACLAMPISL